MVNQPPRWGIYHGDRQPVSVRPHVIIDEGNVATARMPSPKVGRLGKALVHLVLNDPYLGVALADEVHRAVRTAIIDQEDLFALQEGQ